MGRFKVKDFADNSTKVLALLDAAGKATLSEERRKTYAALATKTQTLSATFDRLVKLAAAATADRKALFTVGDDLSAATAALVKVARAGSDAQILSAAQSAESSVLLVRVANWRFLATHDPKGPATFKTNLGLANDALAALEAKGSGPSIAPLIGPVHAHLVEYAASFAKVADGIGAIDPLYADQIRPQISALSDELTGATQSLESASDAATAGAVATISSVTMIQMVAATIATVLGVLLAWLIGRGIVNPITAMTGAMRRLADHDMTTEVVGRDRKDEIGAMAGSVQVFKDNMIKADQLAAAEEVERAAKEQRAARLDDAAARLRGQGGRARRAAGVVRHGNGGDGAVDVGDRRPDHAAGGQCRRGGGGSQRRRADRGRLGRGAQLLDRRDQPPGGAVRRRSPRRRSATRAAPTRPCARWPRARSGSARWWS